MGSGIFFPLCALLFSLLQVSLITLKKHVKTTETKLYKFLVISNFIGIIIELLCTYAAYIYYQNMLLSKIILKLYLVCIITWVYIFTIYIIFISVKNFKEKVKKIYIIITYILIDIIIFVLPINLIIKNDYQIRYTQGLSVYFTYIISGLLILIMTILIIKNIKKLKTKKYIPLLAFLLVGSFSMIIQMIYPGILLITYIETFITVLMYHTIENPDLKMIEELKKNRSLTSKSYIEKSNFLFRMSAELRKPINNIKKINDENIEIDDINEIKENSKEIDNNIRTANFTINNVLNVTSLDSKKIKISNDKFNLLKLLNEIKLRETKKIKNIRFEFNISENLPEYLYGDSIKIKQVLTTLIDKSIERTKQGFIEINIDSINKYDVCRLIITIEDSSTPLSLNEINNILNMDYEIEESDLNNINIDMKIINKLISMMNGSLMIKSNEGNEIILVLDNIIGNFKKEEIINETDILLISNNQKLLKYLESLLKEYTINSVMNGLDAVDLIRSGEHYNLIIIDDEMKPISALDTLKKLKENEIDIPCIVMLEEGKERFKKHYIKDGFIDYILKDDIKNEINRIKKIL